MQFKRLWLVEQWFRSCKSLLETRPIYHQRDETIRGQVFCSFLALLLRYELQARLAARGAVPEWADVLADLERLQYVEVEQEGKRFRLRTQLQGTCGQVFRAVGWPSRRRLSNWGERDGQARRLSATSEGGHSATRGWANHKPLNHR